MYKYIFIAVIVVLASGAYVSRDTLKTYFETGDVPTQEQFGTLIDSTVNKIDDGVKTSAKVVTQAKVLTQNQTEFKLDSPQPVTFRWTPLVPKPQEPVTYRLKVWQLMQGQSGSQAMKTNQPIVTRDVAGITEVTVSGIYTGPCRPPYLCDFVWGVEAVSSLTGSADGTR